MPGTYAPADGTGGDLRQHNAHGKHAHMHEHTEQAI